jgi:hypothetical protein
MGLAQVQELRDAVSHFRQARQHLQQGTGLHVLATYCLVCVACRCGTARSVHDAPPPRLAHLQAARCGQGSCGGLL